MSTEGVRYIFDIDGEELVFEVNSEQAAASESDDYPDWVALEHKQCACCPLKTSDCRYCPVAIRIHEVVQTFGARKSTERADVTVETPGRTYSADVDLQVGVNSLLGLLMATSGCPVLKRLGAMANFHIPFCSTQETLHRTVGSYLTQQYFIQLKGGEPDWELTNLKALYGELEGLNQDISKRIHGALESDAMANAVIMFFATSVVVASSLDDQLKRHEAFLTKSGESG
ncbi:DUF6901 family protein [Coraliomargarita akajimensis]|uniref:Uncharacterized protein n=1 Tax=Coraliomargarita akajimensis (strain DSM 45221 / IAM 15411 / JCM 23193 / KCTC 12865 / 04OKA010-24) TaxID=583355 RepID=D5EMF4_CORAD|nr:hypothetical protein [Coraliomargarita akajimensis]ADE53360.1 conserved hypothetical protein [Coraliomargarita akajimensis DSM 45221]